MHLFCNFIMVHLVPHESKQRKGASTNRSARLFSMWAKWIPAIYMYSSMAGKLT